MNIADKVNTVLDLSGYDALPSSSLPQWLTLAGGVAGIIGAVAICTTYGIYAFNTSKINPRLYRNRKRIIVVGVVATVLCVGIMIISMIVPSNPDMLTFSEYVNGAYGFESSNLPDDKPCDGSLPVTWKKNGEIHSGTLNLLDNEISIKETDGDYLEVTEQASQENGE